MGTLKNFSNSSNKFLLDKFNQQHILWYNKIYAVVDFDSECKYFWFFVQTLYNTMKFYDSIILSNGMLLNQNIT